MSFDKENAPLRVCCECGKWVPVLAIEAGSATKCPCGRRVEVPLMEEFQERTDLLSATTVEDRIRRLIAWKELPQTAQCARCGEMNSLNVVSAKMECESSTVQHHGGERFIYIPFLFWVFWQEEERVEVQGHDTNIPAPICLCKSCQEFLRSRVVSWYANIGWAIFSLALAGLIGYLNVIAGLVVAVIGILVLPIRQYLAIKARQRVLKDVLRKVPVYRQILASYPDTVVVIPPA